MRRLHFVHVCVALACWALASAGCMSGTTPAPSGGGSETSGGTGQQPLTPAVSLILQSSAFSNNGPIPTRNTFAGLNLSPPLIWNGLPAGTLELALTVEDLDNRGFFQWVLYKIPPTTTSLPEGIPANAPTLTNPPGALQGANSAFGIGYSGPNPPAGQTHRFQFTLYALDTNLTLPAGVSGATLVAAVQGHILGQATLTGTVAG